MLTAVDTSVIVAGLLAWHDHHDRALAALERLVASDQLIVPGPALIESYSVLTRLPAAQRLSPTDAAHVLHDSFSAAIVPQLTGTEAWRLLRSLPDRKVAGGRSYDAHILACVHKAGGKSLLTFNVRDFSALSDESIAISAP